MLAYRFWVNLFWTPKLRKKSQPTNNSLKPGLNSIILSQSYRQKPLLSNGFRATASNLLFRGVYNTY